MSEETVLRFEVALGRLEQLVEALERGEPELSAALEKYETGVRLLKHCYATLEQAERSVALLTGVDAEGNPVTEPFDARATIDRERPVSPSVASTPAVRTRRSKASPPLGSDPIDPPF